MQQAAASTLERLLQPLTPIIDEIVLVGGASIPLWVDDPAAPPARPTNDTDVIVAAQSQRHYYRISERLRELGFVEDAESGVICRWQHRLTGWLYDVMPLSADILGFANRWYEDAFRDAVQLVLPDGLAVRAATPAYLVATKFVAFESRGNADFLGSHDMYDIVALIDGHTGIEDEIERAPTALRKWLATRFAELCAGTELDDALLNYVPYDAPADAAAFLADRMKRIADHA